MAEALDAYDVVVLLPRYRCYPERGTETAHDVLGNPAWNRELPVDANCPAGDDRHVNRADLRLLGWTSPGDGPTRTSSCPSPTR
ncbi:hypothetical protein ACIGO6_09085 [Streptomyces sp. NPDC053750]|uniref:hypothetical protein n=1 Tax=Streptomyces sp. NPDC053750 TaxID=3365714 RepID=UPI0037D009BB